MPRTAHAMKSRLLTALMMAAALTGLAPAADSPPPGNPLARQYSERDLPEFRTFFAGPGEITAKEVEDRFGPPPRYSALQIKDEPEDVTREHSWWYYALGKDTRVGVMVDLGI